MNKLPKISASYYSELAKMGNDYLLVLRGECWANFQGTAFNLWPKINSDFNFLLALALRELYIRRALPFKSQAFFNKRFE
jgi:hypothetical protein